MLKQLKDYINWKKNKDEKLQNAKKKIAMKFIDKNLRETDNALKHLRIWVKSCIEVENQIFNKIKVIVRRMQDGSFNLVGSALMKLRKFKNDNKNKLTEKLKFVIKTLRSKDSLNTLKAYNGLLARRELLNGVGVGVEVQVKVNLAKKILTKNYMMLGNSLKYLVDFNNKQKLQDERRKGRIEKIGRRFVDSSLRWQAMGFKTLKQFNDTFGSSKPVKHRIFVQIIKAFYCKIDLSLRMTLYKMQLHRRKEDKKLDEVRFRLQKLKTIAEANYKMLKQRSLYDFRVNFHVNLTFRRCSKLFRALEISDKKVFLAYKLNMNYLIQHKLHNKWSRTIIWNITKHACVTHQIAFWRLKDYYSKPKKGHGMTGERVVKVKKGVEIINKLSKIMISRAFMAIEQILDDNTSFTNRISTNKHKTTMNVPIINNKNDNKNMSKSITVPKKVQIKDTRKKDIDQSPVIRNVSYKTTEDNERFDSQGSPIIQDFVYKGIDQKDLERTKTPIIRKGLEESIDVRDAISVPPVRTSDFREDRPKDISRNRSPLLQAFVKKEMKKTDPKVLKKKEVENVKTNTNARPSPIATTKNVEGDESEGVSPFSRNIKKIYVESEPQSIMESPLPRKLTKNEMEIKSIENGV